MLTFLLLTTLLACDKAPPSRFVELTRIPNPLSREGVRCDHIYKFHTTTLDDEKGDEKAPVTVIYAGEYSWYVEETPEQIAAKCGWDLK